MAYPTPEVQRDGEHNLLAVTFVWSHKTEACDCTTVTVI